MVAVGQGDAEPAGQRQRRCDTGDDRDGHAMPFEHVDLLASAAKDHGIAGLEAHHMLALARKRQHQRVDVVLLAALAGRALAHQHALGLAARQLEHFGGHQIIEQDDIG